MSIRFQQRNSTTSPCHRKQVRQNLRFCVTLALVLVIALLNAVSAEPVRVDHTTLLFQHSFFKSRNWALTKDTVYYDLASGFTAQTPVKTVFTGSELSNIVAFTTAAGSLYLMEVVVQPSVQLISKAKIIAREPVVAPVQVSNALFTLFPVSGNRTDTVFFAHCLNETKIAIHRIETKGFTVVKSDTVASAAKGTPAQMPRGLYGEAIAQKQPKLWLFGIEGMVRYFTCTGQTWSVENKVDIEQTEQVTALSWDILGTGTGKLYRFNGSSFAFFLQNGSESICAINAEGAIGTGGAISRRINSNNDTLNQWVKLTATVPANRYINFHFIAKSSGTGIELLDTAYRYTTATLSDTITTYSATPAAVNAWINNPTPFKLSQTGIDTITIKLRDIDGNSQLPSIMTSDSKDILDNGTQKLLSMHPDTACVPGFIDLADSLLTLIFNASSVSFSTRARSATYNAITSSYYWKYSQFTTTTPLSSGTIVTIKLGSQILKLEKRPGQTSIDQVIGLSGPQTFMRLRMNGEATLFYNAAVINTISIYSAAGRVVYTLPATSTAAQTPVMAPGILFLHFSTTDGRRFVKTISLVKASTLLFSPIGKK
ncbi:MAG: hypothetical protein JW795_10890 [Chitinivibrionales bacterium]|nr:hypothetical protein [Chitinivibrionales bacterium]